MDVMFSVGQISIEMVVAFFASVVANWAYFEFRRTGERGFKRFVAFWMGTPFSFLTMLSVSASHGPQVREDDEGIAELVEEIKRDRLARGERPNDLLT